MPTTGHQEHRAGSAMCMGCQHVRKRVSERDSNPHGCDLRRCSLASYRQADNHRSESCICVRGGTRSPLVVLHHRFGDAAPVQANTARDGRARIPQATRGGRTGLPGRSRHVTCGNNEDGEPGSGRTQGRTAAARSTALRGRAVAHQRRRVRPDAQPAAVRPTDHGPAGSYLGLCQTGRGIRRTRLRRLDQLRTQRRAAADRHAAGQRRNRQADIHPGCGTPPREILPANARWKLTSD